MRFLALLSFFATITHSTLQPGQQVQTASSNDVAIGLGINPTFPKDDVDTYFETLSQESQFHYWRAAITTIEFNNKRWGRYAAKAGAKLVFQCREEQSPNEVVSAVKQANEEGYANGATQPVVAFVEAWNEPFYTAKGDRYTIDRVATVKSGVQPVRQALKANPDTSYVKFIGPIASPPPEGSWPSPENFSSIGDYAPIHIFLKKGDATSYDVDYPLYGFMRNHYKGLPVAVTEFGATTGAGLSDEAQALYVPRLWMELIAPMTQFPGPYPCLIYNHRNIPGIDPWEGNFGITTADGTQKPVYGSMKALHDALKTDDPTTRVKIQYQLGKDPALKSLFLSRGQQVIALLWRQVNLGDGRATVSLHINGYIPTRVQRLLGKADASGNYWQEGGIPTNATLQTQVGAELVLVAFDPQSN